MGYRLVQALARLLVSLFYRRVEVVGLERIPADGPLILTANHGNSLVDPMLLLATIPRRLTALAKAPLFRYPLFGPLLRLVGAFPVQRRQDPGSDMSLNEAIFGAVIAALGRGEAILIFPEGVSQPEPVLMPLRTGAARMLLGAERAAGGTRRVTLLPVGLSFQDPGAFRTGWALILVGHPVATEDCVRLSPEAPEAAVRRLTDRLAEALRQLIVEAEDRETLRLLQAAEFIWQGESADAPGEAARRAHGWQRVMRAYRDLLPREPARVKRFRGEVERYTKDLELAGLTGRELFRPQTPGAAWRYAIREGLSLVLGLPLALWGMAVHGIPYWLTALSVRVLEPRPDAEAIFKMTGGLLLFPLCWIGEGWLAWRLGGGWLLGLFAASLVPTGFFALTWQDRLRRFAREARAFLVFLADRDLPRRLASRRQALREEFAELARRVPDPPHPTSPPGAEDKR